MIRGFYTALSGVIEAMTRTAIVSDNIANANTPGFKETLSTQADFGFEVGQAQGGDLGWLGTATYATNPRLDLSMGALDSTGSPTDLAIVGEGLFAVGRADGTIAYTRAGDFTVDASGTLVTQAGERILDVAGHPITVPGGASALQVAPDGTVAATGQQIAVVAWPANGFNRIGGNLYLPTQQVHLLTGAVVQQGYLEHSNTDMAGAMVDLIALQRSFQLSARALTLADQTLADANSVGRLR